MLGTPKFDPLGAHKLPCKSVVERVLLESDVNSQEGPSSYLTMSTVVSPEFLEHLAELHNQHSSQPPRLQWYLTTIIAFGGMNYPELIPELYEILLKAYIPEEKHETETRKIREGLTKVCGIWGAAKVIIPRDLK